MYKQGNKHARSQIAEAEKPLNGVPRCGAESKLTLSSHEEANKHFQKNVDVAGLNEWSDRM